MKGECYACGKSLAVVGDAEEITACSECEQEAREDECVTRRDFVQFYALKRIETRQQHPERGV